MEHYLFVFLIYSNLVFFFVSFLNAYASMFFNIHSLISILIILACRTIQCYLLSFDALGNKEAINALHKANHVISYNNIRMQNAAWSRMVSENRLHFPDFHKDVTTHSAIDDGRQ